MIYYYVFFNTGILTDCSGEPGKYSNGSRSSVKPIIVPDSHYFPSNIESHQIEFVNNLTQ
jgi:hypothetical protein